MTYTFDDAIEELEKLQGSAGYATQGEPEALRFSGLDVNWFLNEATQVIEKLREEYAPTVEMTARGKKYFDSARKQPDKDLFDTFAIFDKRQQDELDKVYGTADIRGLTNGYQALAGPLAKRSEHVDEILEKYTTPFLQAWLHPETIKVVDE